MYTNLHSPAGNGPGRKELALPRIGITGHTNLTPASFPLVTDAVRATLAGYAGAELAGVTCLARGTDQLFARALLDLGGTLHVVLPSTSYRERIAPDDLDEFDALLDRAA